MATTRQWFCVLLIVLGAFVAAGFAGALGSSMLGRWDTPGAGMCAAAAVVLFAYIFAPHHNLLFATISLVAGSILAWVLLEPSWYPESYGERAYQPTHWPLVATYMGGGIAWCIACIFRLKAGPNHSFMPPSSRDAA